MSLRPSYKWLNIKELVEAQLLPAGYDVHKIRYFTARVSGAADPGSPKRQQIYLSALSTLAETEIHFGNFLAKTIWRPTVNLPIADKAISTTPNTTIPAGTFEVLDQNGIVQTLTVGNYPSKGSRKSRTPPRLANNILKTEVHTMEEKGSDVNLASHLLNDAWADNYDAAVVISNDTDLVTPIRMVSLERKKEVFVVGPSKFGVAQPLQNVSTYIRHIRPAMLAASQFDDPVPGTTIRRPPNW